MRWKNKYCYKCSYLLVPETYDEIKESEERRIMKMEEQIQNAYTITKKY
jgi:RNase P subunit RPR2